MDFFKVIESRHSYRDAYADKPVPDDDLIKILDAGIRAPSGCNAQTTSFIVVTNPELRSRIAQIIDNDPVRTAPALIIVVTEKLTFDFGLDFEIEDYAAAVENILLAITALGYASCWYDGDVRAGQSPHSGEIAAILNVPECKQIRCILPVGVPIKPGIQRGRKPFDERVEWRG